MRSSMLAATVLYFAVVLSGCSSGVTPTSPSGLSDGMSQLTGSPQIDGMAAQTGTPHQLWGYWTLAFDRENNSVDIVPVREANLHVNVVKFLEGKTLFLSLSNLMISSGEINVDVSLTHPFPGLNQYTGFDVRGIFISPGTVAGYTDTGIIHAGSDETHLLNADGWTRWWNPSEFPMNGTILAYTNGKLGNPYSAGNLNATLNGYKYYCDDLQKDDPLSMLNPAHRGMFQSGYTNARHFQIHFDPAKPLVFNYAVDASWDLPVPNPPIAVPGDFPEVANAPEAYRISASASENDLFYVDDINKGGHAVVKVDVYTWRPKDGTVEKYYELNYEVPGVWSIDSAVPVGGNSQYSSYEFELDGSLLNSASPRDGLIEVVCPENKYTVGNLTDDNVTTYSFFAVPVSATAEAPTVVSIDPNHQFIKQVLTDVVVTGTNFASDAQVTIINHANPTIVIDATNEVPTGGTSIVCDLDFNGATVVAGKYDVRVTNTGTGLYGDLVDGFTVDDIEAPWPGWMAAGKNQAASKYVGYGSAGAPTAPKWTFVPPGSPSGATAGCAIANDGTVYVNVYNSATYAVNPDGTQKWKFNPVTPWVCTSPAIDKEGYVYVTMGSPSVDYLYKIDPVTGSAVWSCNLGNIPCYPGAPAIGQDGAIYVYTGSILNPAKLQRVNPDGTLGWYVNLYSFAYSYTWQLGTGVLDNGDLVCSGGSTGKIFCFHPDGTPVWEYQYTSWTLETPCVGPEGNIYFTTWEGGELVALHPDGTFYWNYDTTFYLWANPVVDPVTGNVFFGDRLGKFRCFTPTGSVVWTHDFTVTHIDGTAAVDGNGDVYCAVGNQPSQPNKCLVKMDGATGNTIWQSDDLGYMLTSSPSIDADGSIYLPGYDYLHVLFKWGN
jgi:hypothetical protein